MITYFPLSLSSLQLLPCAPICSVSNLYDLFFINCYSLSPKYKYNLLSLYKYYLYAYDFRDDLLVLNNQLVHSLGKDYVSRSQHSLAAYITLTRVGAQYSFLDNSRRLNLTVKLPGPLAFHLSAPLLQRSRVPGVGAGSPPRLSELPKLRRGLHIGAVRSLLPPFPVLTMEHQRFWGQNEEEIHWMLTVLWKSRDSKTKNYERRRPNSNESKQKSTGRLGQLIQMKTHSTIFLPSFVPLFVPSCPSLSSFSITSLSLSRQLSNNEMDTY